MGYRVGVFKPIESGVEDIPLDGNLLLETASRFNPSFKRIALKDIVPITLSLPAAPYVAKEGDIDFEKLKESEKKLSKECDILLIEGAGGLFTPIEKNFYIHDFIEFFEIDKTLLVCDYRLGCINNALLNIEFLKQKKVDFIWAINDKENSFYTISLPFFKDNFSPLYLLSKDLKEVANSLL
jgi:dethiobiotin synthetase